MNLRLSSWSKLALVLGVAAASVLVSDQAQASNMGFKMNKIVVATGVPAPKGENWIALPYRNPYANAQDICAALGLTASTGKVKMVVAADGTQPSHNCGALGAFALPKPYTSVGLIVTNVTAAGGIIVGSHAGNPPATMTLSPVGTPAPKGINYFSIPYHTTAVTAQDLCVDLGLPAGGKIVRLDATVGSQPSHNCGALGAFNLILGESVQVTFPGASPLVVAAGHPAHF